MSGRPATVCFPFVGDTIGGSHISTLLLIQHLDRRRFKPLAVVHEPGPLTEHLERQGVPYELLPLTAYVGRQPTAWRQIAALANTLDPIRRFLRRHGVAIVHTQDARMHVTWMLPARLAKIAVVWHQRTRFAPSRLARLMMRLASQVVCISRFVLGSLPPAVARRARVIPNSVVADDRELDRAAHRAELLRAADAPEDAFLIATIGNLRAVKRPLLFVEAAARMKRDLGRPLLLVVFGEDREGFEPRMRAIAAREGLADWLLFMGFRRPVEPWIAACDLVLAPSAGDAFGRTLVEAMLLGVPVVATDAGGHGEIVRHGETGLLVPPDDADAMAAACVTLVQDPELASAIADRAREDALARFGIARHVEAVEGTYRAALARETIVNADIALVISDLGGGGAQRVATTLAGAWSEDGRRVTLITLSAAAGDVVPVPPAVRRAALDLVGGSGSPLGGLMANMRRIRALRRAIAESGAGVVIGFVGATNVITILAGIGLGKRIVVCERNDPARQSLGPVWDLLRRLCYRLANQVTANNRSALRALAAYVPEAKLALTPNPVLAPAVDPAPRGNGRFMLAVGRLHPQKGFDVLSPRARKKRRPARRLAAETAGRRSAVSSAAGPGGRAGRGRSGGLGGLCARSLSLVRGGRRLRPAVALRRHAERASGSSGDGPPRHRHRRLPGPAGIRRGRRIRIGRPGRERRRAGAGDGPAHGRRRPRETSGRRGTPPRARRRGAAARDGGLEPGARRTTRDRAGARGDRAMNKVLVTGADGFIGSHLVDALVAEGHAVRAMAQYNAFNSWGWLDHLDPEVIAAIEVFPGDVRDSTRVREAVKGCDIVFHLAALIAIPYSYCSPESYVDTNVKGALNVVQAARDLGIERVIHTSTSEVYGTALRVPIDEDHPLQAQSPYAASKIGADQIALSFHRSFGTPVVILRPFNTYGPRQSIRAVIPTIITQILDGRRQLELGSLHPTRDFTYVEDTVAGFIAAADAPPERVAGQVVNLGSNFEISIADTVRLIAACMDAEVSVETDDQRLRPPDSEVERLWCDNRRAGELLGWRPAFGGGDGFRRGLEMTIEWYSDDSNRAQFKTELYNL